jgi:hypothetical protein
VSLTLVSGVSDGRNFFKADFAMDEPPPRPGDPSNPTGTALFVAGMLTRLEKMARAVGLDDIAYFVSIAKSVGERLIWLERATCPKSLRADGGIACTGKIVTARSLMFPGSPGQRHVLAGC